MPTLKHKVYAYITHGPRLLVFRHTDFPAAGLQVPGGTVKEGEPPQDAVMREALEETGLTELTLVSFLGEWTRDASDGGPAHHRHFYHLRCASHPPAAWQHDETDPSDGTPGPIRFEFFWADLSPLPELAGDQGKLLPELLRQLSGP